MENIAFLSLQILKQTLTTKKFGETFWYWVLQQVEKQPFLKKWLTEIKISAVKLFKEKEAIIDSHFELKNYLDLNHLVKFVPRNGYNTRYMSRHQLWLTNLVRTLLKKSGDFCFCLDKRPHVFGAARYRSQVENCETQYSYLNSKTSDKLFNTFMSKRTNDSDQIEFIMEKQVGETDSGQINKLQAKHDDKSDDRVSEFEQRQRGGGTDRLPRE